MASAILLALMPQHAVGLGAQASWPHRALRPPSAPIAQASLTREFKLTFGPPEPVLNEGRLIGFHMHNCDLAPIGGLLLMPVKVVIVKADWGLKPRAVELLVRDIRKFKADYKLGSPPRPLPVLPQGSHYLPLEPIRPARWGLLGPHWMDYEVHYGIDPEDLERKVFLIVRIFPASYDPLEHEVTWIREAVLHVEFSGTPAGPESSEALLLIITSWRFLSAAEELAELKNSSGVPTLIRTLDWISVSFEGRDLQERIRNCVRYMVDTYGIKFVILLGDHDIVPTRLVYIPDGCEDDMESKDGSLVETDLYYADVFPANMTWDDDKDGLWGEMPDDSMDLFPDVMVGRLPASTLDEAMGMVEKIEAYLNATSSANKAWFFRAVLVGTDLFTDEPGPEGEIVKDNATAALSSKFWCVKLYETKGTLSRFSLLSQLQKGCGLLNFVGHGLPDAWALGRLDTIWTNDVLDLTNGPKFPVVVTAACSTARFSDRDCIGEDFLLNPDGGAIAYFGCTRVAWMFVSEWAPCGLAGLMDILLTRALSKGPVLLGQAWAEAIENYTATMSVYEPEPTTGYYLDWKTVAEYGTMFGDPTVLFYNATGTYGLAVACLDADGERVIEGVKVELAEASGSVVAEGTSGPDGLVSFNGLSPGVYEIRAYYGAVQVHEAISVFVPRSGLLRLRCSFFDLNVRLLDAGGEPLEGVLLVLGSNSSLQLANTSGPGGLLRLEDLPPLMYSFRAYWDRPFRTKVASGTFNLTYDEQELLVNCTVLDFYIRVVDLWGRPIEGALVAVMTENGTPIGSYRTGPDGRVEIRDMAPGTYRASVSVSLWPEVKREFKVEYNGQVIQVRLARPFSPLELCLLIVFASAALLVFVRRVLHHRTLPHHGQFFHGAPVEPQA